MSEIEMYGNMNFHTSENICNVYFYILGRKWQPTPVFLPTTFHGQRSLAGYSPWGYKELDMTKRLSTIFIYRYLYIYIDTHIQIYI